MSWVYTVGLSNKEVNEELIKKAGFKYKKAIVEESLNETIGEVMDSKYKNPSSMRLDAPEYFSCSSLISYLYTKAGVWMPSLSVDKYVFGMPVTKEELQFGDLVFSNTGEGKIHFETVEYKPGIKVPEGVDHVGLYIGDNKILHATKIFGKVLIQNFEEFEKLSKIVGFRRVADMIEERFVVIVPEDRPDLRDREALLREILG